MIINPYVFAAAPAVTVTFDPAQVGASITLSSGNLVMTKGSVTGVWRGTRGTLGRNSGKYVFAITSLVGVSDGWLCGLGGAGWQPNGSTNLFPGQTADSYGLLSSGGQCYTNNATVGTALGATGTTGTMQFAVDFAAGKIWVGQNNTWDGNPAAGTGNRFTFTPGTTLYPGVSAYRTTQSCRLKAAPGDYPYTVPSGFSTWGS